MPIDSDAAAFVRAIHLAPADDAPRLILADWYDDHGDHDRAKLIRWMVRVPSYRFFWRQARWAKTPKHEHKETIKDIRGLKPRLSILCREEWKARPGVEQVIYRRGLGESVTVAVNVFLATAGELFAAHPFREVELAALRPRMAATHWPRVEATLTPHEPAHDFWPLALFPEREAWSVVDYENWAAALADLSRRAAGYGRRMAGVVVEPPPLPRAKRAEAPTGRPEGYGIAGAVIA